MDVSIPDVAQTALDKLKDLVNRSKRIQITDIKITARFEVQSGTKCCDPEKFVDPTPFKQYSGGADLEVSASVPITPYNWYASGSASAPDLGTFFVSARLTAGPEVKPHLTGSLSVTGDDSDCSCLTGSGSISGELTGALTATGTGKVSYVAPPEAPFLRGSRVFADVDLTAEGDGTTGMGIEGSYSKGKGCKPPASPPPGLSGVKGEIGGLTLAVHLHAKLKVGTVKLPVGFDFPYDKQWLIVRPWKFAA